MKYFNYNFDLESIKYVKKEYFKRKISRYGARSMLLLSGLSIHDSEKLLKKIDKKYREGLN